MQTIGASDADEHRRLELALGEQINALISTTRSFSERSAAHFYEGLQPAAFHIARWLYAFGPAKPSVVAEAIGMDRSSTSTLVGKMRSRGLLASSPDPDDRRGVIVSLTEIGEERVSATLQERGSEFFSTTRDWSSRDLDQLVRLLKKLTGGNT